MSKKIKSRRFPDLNARHGPGRTTEYAWWSITPSGARETGTPHRFYSAQEVAQIRQNLSDNPGLELREVIHEEATAKAAVAADSVPIEEAAPPTKRRKKVA